MQREFAPAVYLMASQRNGTTYLGVTSNLLQRVAQHRAGTFDGFTRQHNVKRLVWFELHATMEQAILREKRVKKWRRVWKLELIEADNLGWRDLAEDFGFQPLATTGVPAFAGMTKNGRCPLSTHCRRKSPLPFSSPSTWSVTGGITQAISSEGARSDGRDHCTGSCRRVLRSPRLHCFSGFQIGT